MSEETQPSLVDDQVASEDWRSAIPEDLRKEPSLADIQDVAGLAKGYVHAQHMIGSDKVAIPPRDATQEVMDDFYNKLGRPQTSDGYEIPKENMPEDVPMENEYVKNFFDEAHRIGLTKSQAAACIRWQANTVHNGMEEGFQETEMALEKAADDMRREFGKSYDEKMDMAKRAAKQFGGDELMVLLDSSGLGNNPTFIKTFANIGKAISNDEIIGGGGRQGFILSPSEAKQQISSLKRDPNFMKSYTDTGDAGHLGAVEEMGKLFDLAHPVTDE